MNIKKLTFLAGGIVGFVAGATATAAVFVESLNKAILEAKKEVNIQVGDDINWESDGQLMFKTPKQVLRIIDSEEHGKYVFVDGVTTGIPYTQCVKE